MRAVVWKGEHDIAVEEVADPVLKEPTDVIIEVTSTGICGSDLHLYEAMGPFMDAGDILGHEAMGRVVEVGAQVRNVSVGDRVVIPFNISCGTCFMCERGLQSQCETTQVRSEEKGAALFGYTKLYGQVPGGQAEYLRVPQGHYGPIKVPDGPPDDRFVYLSDVLPTAWQAVAYADLPADGTLLVLGLGPIGDMCTRVARHLGVERVIGVERVPERVSRVQARGVQVLQMDDEDEIVQAVRDLTDGRGADGVIDAVGMEAHGSPLVRAARAASTLLPDAANRAVMQTVGVDQLAVLRTAIAAARRGGTVSIVGVYGGAADPLPMLTMFDKQLQLRMGQANVRRWIDDILPLTLDDSDPLGLEGFATHHVPLTEAPQAYKDFASKSDGVVKVLLKP